MEMPCKGDLCTSYGKSQCPACKKDITYEQMNLGSCPHCNAPWRVERARKQAAGWHPDALAFALRAVAEADAAAKGAAADAAYSVERAVLAIAAHRR